MSWLTSLFSSGVDKVVDSVATGLDSLFTSDEERLILKNKLKIELEKFNKEYEDTITDRWKSDNEHYITRLVRPISYVFVLLLFAVMVMFDGNLYSISIKEAYIPVIETLLATMTIAYFGSRGVEKTMKHFKGNNNG